MYKIKIEKITETEYPETERKYYHGTKDEKEGTGELCPQNGCYDKDYCKYRNEQTGKMLKRTDEEKVFEQTVEDALGKL